MENYLGWSLERYESVRNAVDLASVDASRKEPAQPVGAKKLRSPADIRKIIERAGAYQRRAGYDGNYKRWVERHRPIRLEDLN